MRTFILIVFFCLQCILLFSQTSGLRFRHLNVENGLSNSETTSILQDKKGFIWIGTNSGLNRYDGYATEVFYNNTERSKSVYLNRISDMSLAGNNCLWMATEGGLSLFDPSTMAFKKIQFSTTADSIALSAPLLKLTVVKNVIYTVTASNIYVHSVSKNNVLSRVAIKVPSVGWPVFDIKQDKRDRVWVSHTDGISIFGKDNVEMTIGKDLSTGIATALHVDDNGDIYISMERGLYRLSADIIQNLYKVSSGPVKLNKGILQQIASYSFNIRSNTNSYHLRKDATGNFWLSSSSGLKKIQTNSGIVVSYNTKEYVKSTISDNSINSLFIDRSSCLWAGTFGVGVNIADLNQKPFQLLQRMPNTTNTLSSNYIRALLEDEKGNLWIGTRYGGLNYFDSNLEHYKQFYPSNTALESNNIRALTQDKLGRLWIATDTTISIRKNDGSFVNLKKSKENKLISGNYTALGTDIFNTVWAGAWKNGVKRIKYNGNGVVNIENITAGGACKGLLSDNVAFIYADPHKPEVLVGTDHGLNHYFS